MVRHHRLDQSIRRPHLNHHRETRRQTASRRRATSGSKRRNPPATPRRPPAATGIQTIKPLRPVRDAIRSAPPRAPQPGRAHQDPQPLRARMQDAVGEDRHQHRVRHTGEADDRDQLHDGADRDRAAHVVKSLADGLPAPTSMPAAGRNGFTCISRQAPDHRYIADSIGEKTPPFADLRHQDAGDRRSDDPRAVEHRRIQRNRVHQVFRAPPFRPETTAWREYRMRSTTPSKAARTNNLPDP